MRVLHAFIDEAGQRSSTSAKSSRFFILSAVVVTDSSLPAAAALLAKLRTDLGRRPGDALHFRMLRSHPQKLHLSATLGAQDGLLLLSVIVDKRALGGALSDDLAYMYTFRILLEWLSWIARDSGGVLSYTLAHIVRFKLETLREYERRLRGVPGCQVEWSALDPKGGRLDQPTRVEYLQLADAVASASFAAFEPDAFGNTEPRYLSMMAPRLYRRGAGPKRLFSYGLKFHPDSTRAAHPWVAAL